MSKICSWTVLVGLLFVLEVRGESSGTETFSEDAPLDLASFGYVFRADAPPGGNPPETQWLTNDQAYVLAGVMWEEHRPIRQIEVQFAEEAPEASQLSLEVTTSTPTEKQNNRPTWWTRKYEVFPGSGTRSADGRRMVYQSNREAIVQRLSQYPEGFRYEADPNGLIFVDKIRLRYLGAGKPQPSSPCVSLAFPPSSRSEWRLNGVSSRDSRRGAAEGTTREYEENTKRIPREYEENTMATR